MGHEEEKESGSLASVAQREQELSLIATRLDVVALREALLGLGYSDTEIEYRSHKSTVHRSRVVESVTFLPPPRRRAVVTLNLGLLAAQSALPSYFQQILDQQEDESLTAFLNFFSHRLLRGAVLASFPERDTSLFADYWVTRCHLLNLSGKRSLSTVHWLFCRVFPELEVAVRRTVLRRPVRARSMLLGAWGLGDGAVCGGVSYVPTSATAVSLYCDDPVTGDHRPWPLVASERLRQEVFELLHAHGVFLEVSLVLRDQETFLMLAPDQYLGYQPIRPDSTRAPETRQAATARTVVLFSGEVP